MCVIDAKTKTHTATYRSNELVGMVFGYLTAIRFAGYTESGAGKNKTWLCRCVCGKETLKTVYNLKNGSTKSCGCLKGHLVSESKRFKGAAAKQSMLKDAYKRHLRCAQRRGLTSHLSLEEYSKIASMPCAYCGGTSTRKFSNHREMLLNSVDRRDNELFYAANNSVPACCTCQKIKGVLTEAEFLNVVKAVYLHRLEK